MKDYLDKEYMPSDNIVCLNCVGNETIKEIIQTNGEENTCDFCNSSAICITLDGLMEVILDGMHFEYERAIESLGVERGEYIGAMTWYSKELLDELNDDMELKENVLSEVQKLIHDDTWCKRDPYGDSEHNIQTDLWEQFCEMVRKHVRYVFYEIKGESKDIESPYNILRYISDNANSLSLIETLNKETRFYRGRTHRRNNSYTKAEDLASPPHEYAKSNRMSGDGISAFYGANSIGTAIKEIYSSENPCASVATFKNLHPLNVLDLTKISDIEFPSIFDKNNRHLREPLLFFQSLCKYLSRPIEELERIEYIPTQIVAEYFRYIFEFDGKKGIDGIVYPSSKDKDGKYYILFFDQNQCLKASNKLGNDQVLSMVQRSAKQYDVYADVRYEEIPKTKK